MTADYEEPLGGVESAPVTCELRLRWRPTVRQYGARTVVLEALEADHHLRAFRQEQEGMSAELTDDVEVRLTPAGLRLSSLAGPFRPALFESVVGLMLQHVKPERVRVDALFQHLVPLESDYDAARTDAGAALLPVVAASYRVADFAILVDGHDGSDFFQAEFGVVSRSEIPERLAGRQSRVQKESPSAARTRRKWNLDEFADVSLFVESRWHTHDKPPSSRDAASVARAFEHFEGRADVLVKSLAGITSISPVLKEASSGGE